MSREKLITGGILFVLGLSGVLSLLTMEISLPQEAEAALREMFSPTQIKLLLLINPAIMLTVAIVVGLLLYDKVHLELPLFEKLAGKKDQDTNLTGILKNGITGGVIAGVLLVLTGLIFDSYLPEEFTRLGEEVQPTPAVRFLYGGITEEILMRFGLMTFIVWILSRIFRGTNSVIYWAGIFLAAILFAAGHLPTVISAIGDPSATLVFYILIGNSVGGIIYGWLYWKRGLEAAMIAHIFSHVVMLLTSQLLV